MSFSVENEQMAIFSRMWSTGHTNMSFGEAFDDSPPVSVTYLCPKLAGFALIPTSSVWKTEQWSDSQLSV